LTAVGIHCEVGVTYENIEISQEILSSNKNQQKFIVDFSTRTSGASQLSYIGGYNDFNANGTNGLIQVGFESGQIKYSGATPFILSSDEHTVFQQWSVTTKLTDQLQGLQVGNEIIVMLTFCVHPVEPTHKYFQITPQIICEKEKRIHVPLLLNLEELEDTTIIKQKEVTKSHNYKYDVHPAYFAVLFVIIFIIYFTGTQESTKYQIKKTL